MTDTEQVIMCTNRKKMICTECLQTIFTARL